MDNGEVERTTLDFGINSDSKYEKKHNAMQYNTIQWTTICNYELYLLKKWKFELISNEILPIMIFGLTSNM